MAKKKILFAINYMNVGGIETSLLSLINVLSADEFEVHLALMNYGGELFGKIPETVSVHIIHPYRKAMKFLDHPVRETLRRMRGGNAATALKDLTAYAGARVRGTLHPLYAYLLRGDDAFEHMEFDLAVNYAGPSEMLDHYIVNHVSARHRALWLHFDLNHVFDRRKSSRLTHGGYDRVFCVSPDVRRVYCERYPEFASKAEVFPNIIDRDAVRAMAQRPGVFAPRKGCVNIVTVGRLEHIKGQDMALQALALLPVNFHWHFVGGGVDGEPERLDALSRKLDVDKRAHFHGMQSNPYPFMKEADIYVQPSRSEGASITVPEAALFDAPIVLTPFTVARQLVDSIGGGAIIADRMTPQALAKAIVEAGNMPSEPRRPDAARRHSPVETIRKIFN